MDNNITQSTNTILSVHYKLNPKTSSSSALMWKYTNIPNGWIWSGCGYHMATDSFYADYPSDISFEGTSINKVTVYIYLHDFFSDLQTNGIIKQFTIRVAA